MLATLRTLGVGVSGVAVMPLGATPLPQAAASDGITAVDTTQPSPDFGGVEAGL
jgi:hypothetical protein